MIKRIRRLSRQVKRTFIVYLILLFGWLSLFCGTNIYLLFYPKDDFQITKTVDVFWFLTVFPILCYLIYLDAYFYKIGRRFLLLLNESELGTPKDRVSHLVLFIFSIILFMYVFGKIFSYVYPYIMMETDRECSYLGKTLIRVAQPYGDAVEPLIGLFLISAVRFMTQDIDEEAATTSYKDTMSRGLTDAAGLPQIEEGFS